MKFRFPVSLAACVLAALFAVGCGRTEPVASDAETTTTVTTAATTAATTTTTQPAEQPTSYVVQPGDSVGGIATAFGLAPSVLAEYNNLENPDRIAVGEQLLIPPGATSTSTTPTTAAAPPESTDTTAAADG